MKMSLQIRRLLRSIRESKDRKESIEKVHVLLRKICCTKKGIQFAFYCPQVKLAVMDRLCKFILVDKETSFIKYWKILIRLDSLVV